MSEQVFRYGKKRFQKHMRSKEAYWKPMHTHIGDDFAVFEFDFKYQMDNAFDGAKYWNESYNYGVMCDGDKQFVIVNHTVKKPIPNTILID